MAVQRRAMRAELRTRKRIKLQLTVSPQWHAHSVAEFQVLGSNLVVQEHLEVVSGMVSFCDPD